MSRYPLTPRTDRADLARATIGWDRPLATFFIQAFGPADEDGEEPVLLWAGTAPGEIAQAAEAIARIAPFAAIPDALEAQLEADRRDGFDQRDGPMQTAAKRTLF